MSILKILKNLINIDWPQILNQYSGGALLIEILILPIWFYTTGLSYFNLKRLLQCNSLICYKISLLFSLIPSSILGGFLSGCSRKYLFKNGYKITTISVDQTPKPFYVNNRTLIVCLFALSITSITSISVKYVVCKTKPNSRFAYNIKTFKPRLRNKIQNLKRKLKTRTKRVKKFLIRNKE